MGLQWTYWTVIKTLSIAIHMHLTGGNQPVHQDQGLVAFVNIVLGCQTSAGRVWLSQSAMLVTTVCQATYPWPCFCDDLNHESNHTSKDAWVEIIAGQEEGSRGDSLGDKLPGSSGTTPRCCCQGCSVPRHQRVTQQHLGVKALRVALQPLFRQTCTGQDLRCAWTNGREWLSAWHDQYL